MAASKKSTASALRSEYEAAKRAYHAKGRALAKATGKKATSGNRAGGGMTKKDAVAQFKAYVLPQVKAQYERDGRIDRPARAEAWNDFTDSLQRDGQISMRQYETWTHP